MFLHFHKPTPNGYDDIRVRYDQIVAVERHTNNTVLLSSPAGFFVVEGTVDGVVAKIERTHELSFPTPRANQ